LNEILEELFLFCLQSFQFEDALSNLIVILVHDLTTDSIHLVDVQTDVAVEVLVLLYFGGFSLKQFVIEIILLVQSLLQETVELGCCEIDAPLLLDLGSVVIRLKKRF
jgi:hypothetical protein